VTDLQKLDFFDTQIYGVSGCQSFQVRLNLLQTNFPESFVGADVHFSVGEGWGGVGGFFEGVGSDRFKFIVGFEYDGVSGFVHRVDVFSESGQ
jgi:hypothetical protein